VKTAGEFIDITDKMYRTFPGESAQKMTKRAALVDRLQRLTDAALVRRSQYAGFWDVVDKDYRQSQHEPKGTDPNRLTEVVPGRTYRFVHATESATFSTNYKYTLEGYIPTVPQEGVELLEDILNQEMKVESRYTREQRMTVRDASKYGNGISSTFIEIDFDELEDNGTKLPEDPNEREIAMAAEAAVAEEMSTRSLPLREHTWRGDSRVYENEVTTLRKSRHFFFIDPDATSLDDAKYMGELIPAMLAAVQEDDSLKETKSIAPTPVEQFKMFGDSIYRGYGKERADESIYPMVLMVAIWTKNPDGTWNYAVFPYGQSALCLNAHDPFWCGHPYEDLRWNEDGESYYAQSDLLPVRSEILAERMTFTKTIDGFSREQEDMTFVDNAVFPQTEEMVKVMSMPGGGKVIPVNGKGQALSNSFFRPQQSVQSGEVLNLLAVLERSIMSSSGISPNMQGQALKSGTTATEASNIAGNDRQSMEHKSAAAEEYFARVARKRLALYLQFYDATRIGQLYGAKAAEIWAKIPKDRALVQHNLRVSVVPGSAKKESDDVRAQRLLGLLQITTQTPEYMAAVDRLEILRELMRAMGFSRMNKILLTQDSQQVAMAGIMRALASQGGGGTEGGSPPAPPAMPSGDAGMQQVMR